MPDDIFCTELRLMYIKEQIPVMKSLLQRSDVTNSKYVNEVKATAPSLPYDIKDLENYTKYYQKNLLLKECFTGVIASVFFFLNPVFPIFAFNIISYIHFKKYFNKTKEARSLLKEYRILNEQLENCSIEIESYEKKKKMEYALTYLYLELLSEISLIDPSLQRKFYQKILEELKENKEDKEKIYIALYKIREELGTLESRKSDRNYRYEDVDKVENALEFFRLKKEFDPKLIIYIDGLIATLRKDLQEKYQLIFGKLITDILSSNPKIEGCDNVYNIVLSYLKEVLVDNEEYRKLRKKEAYTKRELVKEGIEILKREREFIPKR